MKWFKRALLIYFLLFLVLLTALSGMFIYGTAARAQESNRRDLEERCRSLANTLDQKMSVFHELATQLTFSPWLEKARSTQEIIYGSLDYFRRVDIIREIQNYKTILEITSNVAIYLPRRDIVINQRSWWKAEDFFFDVGKLTEDDKKAILNSAAQEDAFRLTSFQEIGVSGSVPDSLLVMQSLDVGTPPKAVLMIFIDPVLLTNWLVDSGQNPEFGLSIRKGESELFSSDTFGEGQGDIYSTVIHSNFGFDYSISLPLIQENNIQPYIYLLIILTASSLVVAYAAAYGLAKLSYHPISRLMQKTNAAAGRAMETKDELTAIEAAFDELVQQKEELETTVSQYCISARNSFLINLLEGYFGTDLDYQLQFLNIFFNTETAVQVLLVTIEEPQEAAGQFLKLFMAEKAFFQKEKLSCEIVPLNQEQIAAILTLSDFSFGSITQKGQLLERYLLKELEVPVDVSYGTEEKGILGISRSYQHAKESQINSIYGDLPNRTFSQEVHYYFPTDWEVQFINNLKLGKMEQSCAILEEIRLENLKRPPLAQQKLHLLLHETLLRVIFECGLDVELPAQPNCAAQPNNLEEEVPADEQWAYLKQVITLICQRSRAASSDGIGLEILRYVEENYSDVNLSLKDLEYQFQISTSKIFRIFKNTVNITYHEYLCRVRLKKAKELFQQNNVSIADVARAVGYENERSFIRTFLRYEGVRPKAYVDELKRNADK